MQHFGFDPFTSFITKKPVKALYSATPKLGCQVIFCGAKIHNPLQLLKLDDIALKSKSSRVYKILFVVQVI